MIQVFQMSIELNGAQRQALVIGDPQEAGFQLSHNRLLGYLVDPAAGLVKGNFIANPNFLKFFHQTVLFTSTNAAGLYQSAELNNQGLVTVIDKRATDDNDLRHIIGSFEVHNGEVIEGSYQANSAFELINEKGPFDLGEEFEKIFLVAIT